MIEDLLLILRTNVLAVDRFSRFSVYPSNTERSVFQSTVGVLDLTHNPCQLEATFDSKLVPCLHRVRELPQGPTSAKLVTTMTSSGSTRPQSLARSSDDLADSRGGKSGLKFAQGVKLTVWRTRSSFLKSAALSWATARQRAFFCRKSW